MSVLAEPAGPGLQTYPAPLHHVPKRVSRPFFSCFSQNDQLPFRVLQTCALLAVGSWQLAVGSALDKLNSGNERGAMVLRLFELCGEDRDVRFSPAVWRTRMQLMNKGLDFEGIPTMFLEKDDYKTSGSKTVPVIEDGEAFVADSYHIALYLDQNYPEKPLMEGTTGIAQAAFFNNWVLVTVLSQLFPMIAANVVKLLSPENADYFRKTREKALGRTLEEAQAASLPNLEVLRGSLMPARMTLKNQDFLSGIQPAFNDYCLFGVFMWCRIVSSIALLADDDPLYAWNERMLDLFDGHARAAKRGI